MIHQEVKGAFYHMRYPLKDEDGFIEIATTRPETMLGDTAVAVHPEDDRYNHLIGKKVILPIVGREIEIIGDDYVDMEFGSGAVKITPAHDPNDFEIGNRHNLERVLVMDEGGQMNKNAGKYEGMDRFECRKQLVKDLQEEGVLFHIEEHMHSVGHSERSGAVVEPYLSTQWFVKMGPLAEEAIKLQQTEDKVNLSQNVLNKRISIGWKTSAIGVSRVNYGGDIEFQLGTIKKQVSYMSVEKLQKIWRIGNKMTMSWIHGSPLLYGLSQRWAGQMNPVKITTGISQRVHL